MRHELYGRRTTDVAVCVPSLGRVDSRLQARGVHFKQLLYNVQGRSENSHRLR
jgi:hypothetical protein